MKMLRTIVCAFVFLSALNYHASFMSIHWWPREFLEANRETIDKINLRLGYRLQPVEVTWPRSVQAASSLDSDSQYGDVTRHGSVTRRFIALPLKDNDGRRRYRLGPITIQED